MEQNGYRLFEGDKTKECIKCPLGALLPKALNIIRYIILYDKVLGSK